MLHLRNENYLSMVANNISPTLGVRLITTNAEAVSIASQWNRLAGGVPFRQWEWYQAWWRHFGDQYQLFLLMVEHEGSCVGIAPFCTAQVGPLGRVVRMLGSGEVCSDHQSILAQPRHKPQVGAAIARWFADQIDHTADDSADQPIAGSRASVPRWNLIELSGVDPHCTAIQSFAHTLEQRGFTTHRQSKLSTWRIPLPADMDSYLAALSKPCRRKVRTAMKRFQSNECQVTFAESDAEFSEIWDVFVDLHQRRRRSLGSDGCFVDDRFTAFLFDAARTFHAAGLLDFVVVRIDNKPVAAEISFRGAATTFAYQIGIEPDSLRENPGWLVNTASIERAIRLKQSGFDLCRGDEQYKHHLGAEPTPCMTYRLVPPRLRSQAWDAAILASTTLKQWCKSSLAVTGN